MEREQFSNLFAFMFFAAVLCYGVGTWDQIAPIPVPAFFAPMGRSSNSSR